MTEALRLKMPWRGPACAARMIRAGLVVPILMAACGTAAAAGLGASDQLDELDRQELLAHVERARICTRSRDFACAEGQLNQANKFANSGRDRDLLKQAWTDLELSRQTALSDDAKKKYGGERAELEARAEDDRRTADKADRASLANANRTIGSAREREQRAASSSSNYVAEGLRDGMARFQRDSAPITSIHNKAMQDIRSAQLEARARQAERSTQVGEEKMNPQRQQQPHAGPERAPSARSETLASASPRPEVKSGQPAHAPAQTQPRTGNASTEVARKATATKTDAEPPPRVGTPDAPDKDGCYIPVRTYPLCVAAEGKWSKGSSGEYKVRYTNNCGARIYLSTSIQRKDGTWDTGADGLRSGATTTWWTGDSTGQNAFTFTGSTKTESDWVCAGRDAVFERQRK